MIPVELLGVHPFGAGLSASQRERLAGCGRRIELGAGTVVFREGEPADALYLVLSGRIALGQHVPARGDVQLEDLGPGDSLGLSWLRPPRRWVLDARAVEPTVMAALDAACLEARMAEDPALGLAVSRYLVELLYQRLERVRLQRLDVYRADGPGR